ncbi:MAG: glycosyltransferase [Solirubrobacteraceae bacterium]
MAEASVCAFVLTRDRKVLLVECLRGLLAQTRPVDRVVVLDNASSDGTRGLLAAEGLLAEPRVRYVRSEINTGGSGGFRAGVELCLAEGTDWLWLMDDDAEPEPDALERLLAAPVADDPATVVLCTAVVHPDGRVDPQHRCSLGRFVLPLGPEAYAAGRYADVDCASFVGFCVRADVARAIGPVKAEFFLGYDDAEWSLRARRHGRLRLVPESRIVHKIVIGGGEQTRRARVANRLLGQEYSSSSWPGFWKDLYRVRNFIWLKQEHSQIGPLAFVGLTATYCLKALLYDPQPFRRLPWLARYAIKGRRGDFRALTPEVWVRRTASRGRAREPRA